MAPINPFPGDDDDDVVNPLRRLPAPRNVRVDVIDVATFRVRWLDARLQPHPAFLGAFWRVIYCPASISGNPTTGSGEWADRVMRTGLGIHERPVIGRGEELTYIDVDPTKGNGWVVVVGVNEFGLLGYPSEPAFVLLETSTAAIPSDVTNVSLSHSFQLATGGYDVMKLGGSYRSPSDMTNFYGVHLHASGYMGVGKLHEIDSAHQFPGRAGGQSAGVVTWRIPQDSGLGSGTATYTNLSAAVVRLSGSSFTAGMVTRRMMVRYLPGGDTWFDSAVAGFTDANNVTMTSPFTGPTGTYDWVVLNAITFYFVAVSVRGTRRADFTLAPSVTI